MKIAFLFGSLNRGGTETLMLDVFQNLTKSDFDAIGIYRKQGVLEKDFLNSNIPFIKLSVTRNIVAYLYKLRKIIVGNNVEIVHAQQPIDALFARIASLGTKTKTILTLHGFDSGGQHKKDRLLNLILRITDKNIYVSNYQKEYYISKYKLDIQKQAVVYNGISFEKLSQLSVDNNIRIELNLLPDTLLLGMVGNFNEVRDQLTVIRFLKLLNEQNKNNFHFIFIGKKIDNLSDKFDSCVDFCNKFALHDKVSFLGVRNDVPQILPFLDAFIYSTEQDTFGIAVVEAIASGIPVFVNDWPVMTEISESGKYATLYKTKDIEDLYCNFMVFLQDKDKIKKNIAKYADEFKNKYNIQNYICNLKNIYRQFIIHNS